MEIRLANRNDAQAIHDIYAPYVEKTNITFEYDIPSVEQMQERMVSTLKNYPYLVAVDEGKVVGYAYASLFRVRKAYEWDCELSIYVDWNHRGQKIGKPLYLTLLKLLKCMHIQNVYACITHPNESSERFHEQLGFRYVGCFLQSGYKFEKWHDVIWMEKAINDYQHVEDVIPFSQLSSKEISFCLHNIGVQ